MKRKTKRTAKKKWTSIIPSLGAIIAFVLILFNFLKDTLFDILVPLINIWFNQDEKSILGLSLLYFLLFVIIISISYFLSRIFINISKPDKYYFELIDFERPTEDIIKKALNGILNTEKSKPYYVHVAPVNVEIDLIFQKLDKKGFVWINGSPGDGKTMLAYHALYRYRKRNWVTSRLLLIKFLREKYKIYELKVNVITNENEIKLILDELDYLRGGRNKIILIDDAHKLNFEEKLKYEFEEEASEKLNGKFIWIDTNFLENKFGNSDSLKIDFEIFYPKLINDLYKSKNPIVKEIVDKYTCLDAAIQQKQTCKIGDPWHFNFIATNGQERILHSLEKLSNNDDEQDILLLSIFLFSVRNIITGEKEINQSSFADLLTIIDIPRFKKMFEIYQPSKIISDLTSQDKGRFLIIENKNPIDRGYLRAPHISLSYAIIKTVISHISNRNIIRQFIDASKVLFTNDFRNYKYIQNYLSLLGEYQRYFVDETKDWIRKFLTNLFVEQLDVYQSLLNYLKTYHHLFFKELITDEFLIVIASKVSLVGADKFTALQKLIRVLGIYKKKFIDNLDWDILAESTSQAGASQMSQVADLIFVLGDDKNKLIANINFGWKELAKSSNLAGTTQIMQIAEIIQSLGKYKNKLIDELYLIDKFETLAKNANKAEVDNINQVANLVNALGNYRREFLQRLNLYEFAKKANSANIKQIQQVADFIKWLGPEDSRKLFQQTLYNIDGFEKLGKEINLLEVSQFNQLADFLFTLGEYKKKLIEKLDWGKLAQTANKAEVNQFNQLGAFINSLGNDKSNLIKNEYFSLETLARTSNKAKVSQLVQISCLIYVLEEDRVKFSNCLNSDLIFDFSKNIDSNQIGPFCALLASFKKEKQNELICKIDWVSVLNKLIVNFKVQIKTLVYLLNYLEKKCQILKQPIDAEPIKEYLQNNLLNIIRFSIKYFISPDDFLICARLLELLVPYSLEIGTLIAQKLRNKLIYCFIISPPYYNSFAKLLNIIHLINPDYSNFIITNYSVWNRIYKSFKYDNIDDQVIGLGNLVKAINNININKNDEIMMIKRIKDLTI